jgi:hypothetical protein
MKGMRGGNKCPKPVVNNPLSGKSWDNAFNKLNCYWKQQKVDGIIPKMGGLDMINTMNNNVNLTSASLNGFYQNMKQRSQAFDATIDAKIKAMDSWSSQPI